MPDMTGAEIVSVLISISPSVFSHFKRERALNAAEQYLREKYQLTAEYEFTGSVTSGSIRVYNLEWRAKVRELLHRILEAPAPSLAVADDCADFALIMTILDSRRKHTVTSKDTKYARDLCESLTFVSIQNLSRGIGESVALQVAQRELKEWSRKHKL